MWRSVEALWNQTEPPLLLQRNDTLGTLGTVRGRHCESSVAAVALSVCVGGAMVGRHREESLYFTWPKVTSEMLSRLEPATGPRDPSSLFAR